MKSVIADFKEREDSVNCLLSHIEKTSESNGSVNISLILKSSFYIALYNNIEATIYSILEKIHDKCSEYKYYELSDDIQSKFVSFHFGNGSLSLRNKKELTDKISIGCLFFPQLANYSKVKTVFSGNLDCQEIRAVFKSYGIPVQRIRGNPEHLLLVKSKRNKIAHGEQSLSEAGLQTTNKKLKEINHSVSLALMDFILSAELFMEKELYIRNKEVKIY